MKIADINSCQNSTKPNPNGVISLTQGITLCCKTRIQTNPKGVVSNYSDIAPSGQIDYLPDIFHRVIPNIHRVIPYANDYALSGQNRELVLFSVNCTKGAKSLTQGESLCNNNHNQLNPNGVVSNHQDIALSGQIDYLPDIFHRVIPNIHRVISNIHRVIPHANDYALSGQNRELVLFSVNCTKGAKSLTLGESLCNNNHNQPNPNGVVSNHSDIALSGQSKKSVVSFYRVIPNIHRVIPYANDYALSGQNRELVLFSVNCTKDAKSLTQGTTLCNNVHTKPNPKGVLSLININFFLCHNHS